MISVLNLLYPNQCLRCDEMVESQGSLCGACWRDTPFIDGFVCERCGTPLLGLATDGTPICDGCLRNPPPWEQGRAALEYSGEACRLVLALKHGGREDIAPAAAAWMARAGKGILADDCLLVPVPLHWFRLLKRRYNQASLLARGLSQITGHPVAHRALVRPKSTRSLGHGTREERFQMMDGAIQVRGSGAALQGKHVVLVDDVMTTGATLTACTVAAKAAGASRVDILTLARATTDA